MNRGPIKGIVLTILVVLIVNLLSPAVFATGNTFTIHGFVTVNGEKKDGVVVTCSYDGGSKSATTSDGGYYQIVVVSDLQVTVKATYEGHEASSSFLTGTNEGTNCDLTITYSASTPTPSANPSITPIPSANPCATPTVTVSPQPTTSAPSDVDDWILGPGLWSTPTATPIPTAAPTTIITATPTVTPTPTPTPEPTPTASSDMSSWWWLILLLIIIAIVAGYWYFTKQK